MTFPDRGRGSDGIGVGVQAFMTDHGKESTYLDIEKWDEEQVRWLADKLVIPHHALKPQHFRAAGVRPDTFHWKGNLITRTGWADMFTGFFGTQATLFSTTVGRVGVGSGTGPAAATDTALSSVAGLSGSGSNWILSGANPTLNTGATPCTVAITATFGVNDAIGAWNEFAVDHGTANSTAGTPTVTPVGHMINHSASSGLAGTKAASQIWNATVTLSFT
jgi:hypothetical protein